MAAEAAAGAFTHSVTELAMTGFADLTVPKLTLRWQGTPSWSHLSTSPDETEMGYLNMGHG